MDIHNPNAFTPKPASKSKTVQGLAVAAAMTVGPILLQRRPPTMGEIMRLGGLGWALYGRLRPGARQPLTVG